MVFRENGGLVMPESVANSGFAYRAFISYSHRDKAWGDWLHKALETYRVPSRLVGTRTAHGTIPRRLHPIFRDRDELPSAADLGRKVNEALAKSENLIVICSPASATSRWVNEEVLAYKRIGRDGRIFCLIVDGEPNATDTPGRESEECFCPALRFATNAEGRPIAEPAEPIAADARPGKDGKGNAKLKLIAGMLDVGFDALKQREQRRQVQRMTAITALALVVMAVTVVLAIFALVSRHEAVIAQHKAVVAQQAAERRQKQAEGLVNFMLGDLNDKLEQVNRLDIMQAVDDKAMAYFGSLPTTDVTDTALAHRAKALEKIGSVRFNQGNLTGALEAYLASARISSALAQAAPADVARQVASSRTLAFIGLVHWSQGKLDSAQRDFDTARQRLRASQTQGRNDPAWLFQLETLDNDLGHVLEARGQPDAAEAEYRNRLALMRRLVALRPNDSKYAADLGSAHNNLGKMALMRGDLATAVSEYRADDALETRLAERDSKDNRQRENMLRVRAILGRTLAIAGDSETGMRDLEQAVEMAAEHSKADPSNAGSREFLALYSLQLARLKRATGSLPEARTLTAKATSILIALTQKDPSNDDWKVEYAQALTEQAAETQAGGNTKGARRFAQAALDTLTPMVTKHPKERDILLAALEAKLVRASLANDPADAQRLREQALQTMQAVKTSDGDPRLLALEVEALIGLGKSGETSNFIRRLQTSGYQDPAFVAELHRAHIDYRSGGIASQGRHSAARKGAGDSTSRL
ncbi:MAG TPA: TIR domain-containing protein [Rhodanobacteraceae bacterium]|jgi:tetratricopeptide (TPR) repeat protein